MLNLRRESQWYIHVFKLSWMYITCEPLLVMKYFSFDFQCKDVGIGQMLGKFNHVTHNIVLMIITAFRNDKFQY